MGVIVESMVAYAQPLAEKSTNNVVENEGLNAGGVRNPACRL
ncbi:MAG: hypothetical protein PHO37_07825 [Kiritimatiellae bacterium]|nr:hypothetical protein [Kiritimatiellia bacterium]